jgi:hypothetical protein
MEDFVYPVGAKWYNIELFPFCQSPIGPISLSIRQTAIGLLNHAILVEDRIGPYSGRFIWDVYQSALLDVHCTYDVVVRLARLRATSKQLSPAMESVVYSRF